MDLKKIESIMVNSERFHTLYTDKARTAKLNGNDWEKLAVEAHNDRDTLLVMIQDALQNSPQELRRSFKQVAEEMRNGKA